MEAPDHSVLASIEGLLEQAGVRYKKIHHEPTRTSEESAAARGESLGIGGKALLIKLDDVFGLFVLSASLRLDSAAIRQFLGIRRTRFANREELETLTGLVPGSIPPFGAPILKFPLYLDESILENDRIAFNAGSLTDSIVMKVVDYLQVANPTVFRFSRR